MTFSNCIYQCFLPCLLFALMIASGLIQGILQCTMWRTLGHAVMYNNVQFQVVEFFRMLSNLLNIVTTLSLAAISNLLRYSLLSLHILVLIQ